MQDLSWGQLFVAFGLTPGIRAELTSFPSGSQVLSELQSGSQISNSDERMTFMAGLLAPFFCPFISWQDTFEIARTGESSPLMFRLFSERHQIGVVLSQCKMLKSAPSAVLASEGPLVLLRFLIAALTSDHLDAETRKRLGTNFLSYFRGLESEHQASLVATYLNSGKGGDAAQLDLARLILSLPAWTAITSESHPYEWACRHDHVAVALKNADIPNKRVNQQRAAAMIEEAVSVFVSIGEMEDAAVARSNLANLYLKAEWIPVDKKFELANELYEAALRDSRDSRFRALVLDNQAGLMGDAANFGMPVNRQKALELSMQSAAELEKAGETERLPFVLANVVAHMQAMKDETLDRKGDLQKARGLTRRALDLIQRCERSAQAIALETHLKSLLAELLVRSVDYEPEERDVFAQEALDLLGND